LKSSNIKLIALDFDGTLVESNQIKDHAFDTIFNDWPEHKEEMMHWHYSHNSIERKEKFKYFVENFLNVTERDNLIEQLSTKFEKLTRMAIIECAFVNGAEDFLKKIYGRFLVYLVSATPQLELELILKSKGLEVAFNKVYGAPINKKNILKKIIKEEKLLAHEIIYIGDSPEDQDCAKVLGINFIGRYSGRDINDTTHFVFNDFYEIQTHMRKYYAI